MVDFQFLEGGSGLKAIGENTVLHCMAKTSKSLHAASTFPLLAMIGKVSPGKLNLIGGVRLSMNQ